MIDEICDQKKKIVIVQICKIFCFVLGDNFCVRSFDKKKWGKKIGNFLNSLE
jgi:hypothetical protein